MEVMADNESQASKDWSPQMEVGERDEEEEEEDGEDAVVDNDHQVIYLVPLFRIIYFWFSNFFNV